MLEVRSVRDAHEHVKVARGDVFEDDRVVLGGSLALVRLRDLQHILEDWRVRDEEVGVDGEDCILDLNRRDFL